MTKPIIGINSSFAYNQKYIKLSRSYCEAVIKAGGAPVVIPPIKLADVNLYVRKLDGLVFSGGYDIAPHLYGEKPLKLTDRYGIYKLIVSEKMISDLALMKSALRHKTPLLAICYGAQLLNVALSGSLFQDITTQVKPVGSSANNGKSSVKHLWARHKIYICNTSLLHRVVNSNIISVYSAHHQAIKTPGQNLVINARATDTLIEGVELPRKIHPFCLGVQWHPEVTVEVSPPVRGKESPHLKLFQALVRVASSLKYN